MHCNGAISVQFLATSSNMLPKVIIIFQHISTKSEQKTVKEDLSQVFCRLFFLCENKNRTTVFIGVMKIQEFMKLEHIK